MKITFLIQNFSRGHGSERATAIIASCLSIFGYEVQIVSICGDNTSFYSIDKEIKLHTLINRPEVDNKKSFFKVLKAYDNYLRKFKPDIVIDVFAAMSIYSIALRKKHGYKVITWEHYNYFNNMGIYWLSRKIAIKWSNQIVTLTKTDMETYIRNNRKIKGRITYIYNPTPFENVTIRESRDKLVLAVGRLVKLKGYDHLLDVWSIVESKYPDWELIIVGEGEERNKLENKILENNLKRAYLPGETKKVEEYYSRAALLVSTSDIEGLPMNMIEAQSYGVPIISFNCYTGPEDIISPGKDGFIVDDDSQETKNKKMADKIEELINNESLRKKMSDNALTASDRFTKDQISNCWIQLIESLSANAK